MSVLTSLVRRVKSLEQRALPDDSGGGFAPLTVECYDDEDLEAATLAAVAQRKAEGRPIRPITGGGRCIWAVTVVMQRERPDSEGTEDNAAKRAAARLYTLEPFDPGKYGITDGGFDNGN
ncbi:MAG TPA: hypothetical protein VMY80_14015 [Anaerolineae bacterium]|nr:hypothetical protein [Anaerolineae bacterium]